MAWSTCQPELRCGRTTDPIMRCCSCYWYSGDDDGSLEPVALRFWPLVVGRLEVLPCRGVAGFVATPPWLSVHGNLEAK